MPYYLINKVRAGGSNLLVHPWERSKKAVESSRKSNTLALNACVCLTLFGVLAGMLVFTSSYPPGAAHVDRAARTEQLKRGSIGKGGAGKRCLNAFCVASECSIYMLISISVYIHVHMDIYIGMCAYICAGRVLSAVKLKPYIRIFLPSHAEGRAAKGSEMSACIFN